MRLAQPGDHVRVHYVIRAQRGRAVSSRGREPLGLTVGIDHPRLPGLGSALVGLAEGQRATVTVPAERAYGPSDPARVRRWPRRWFADHAELPVGRLIRFTDTRGRRRVVRILRVGTKAVLVDTNHRWAGQALEVEVEILSVRAPDGVPPAPRVDGGEG